MADGLRSGDEVGDVVIEKTALKQFDNELTSEKNDSVNGMECATVNTFYESSDSDKLFNKLCANNGSKHEGILPCEDDCRKKRCVDRYDSSESSDSGVAVLSCTDCSGSSTASSDITDPGSPFSTTSSHSEDSGTGSSQPAKMPPTQTAHHHPWPWTSEDGPPPCKRPLQEKATTVPVAAAPFSKRIKVVSEDTKKTQTLLSAIKSTEPNFVKIISAVPSPNDKLVNHNNNKINKKTVTVTATVEIPKMQQGKITEYFRSQGKANGIKKELLNLVKQSESLVKKVTTEKKLVDEQTQLNSLIKEAAATADKTDRQTQFNSLKLPYLRKWKTDKSPTQKPTPKKKKIPPAKTHHRKILPAPFIPDRITIDEQLNNIANFQSAMTLTPLSFPSNYTYMHTRGPKPPEPTNAILVPQFATLANNKVPIPVLNGAAPCLNVIQPVQKITTINNFNCVKLNTTVVPIVKVNALPSRLNGSVSIPNVPAAPANLAGVIAPPPSIPSIALSVETAVPTVLAAKPKLSENCVTNFAPPKQLFATSSSTTTKIVQNVHIQCRMDDDSRTEEPHRTEECTKDEEEVFPNDESSASSSPPRTQEKSPTPDSDSGLSSNKECCLEVSVSETTTVLIEQQKSPILSQPKTIRFPARQDPKEEVKSPQQSTDGRCRWAECNSRFDTSGALLEHLQVKHVISQSTQEHYVCLWLGCKVHGRTSCSRSWLERHVLAHAGTKPFRCIVDGCGQRFNSQLMLERHVNGHFNTDGSPNNNAKKTTSDNNVVKLFKRNGKKIRFRRQPWSARMFDFIDSGIMEGLQHNLLLLTQKRTLGKISAPGDTIHLQSQILARRIETDGSVKYLLKWHPPDVVPDEWVSESEYKPTKFVSIPSLDSSSRTALSPALFSSSSKTGEEQQQQQQQHKPKEKHRRKPVANVKRT